MLSTDRNIGDKTDIIKHIIIEYRIPTYIHEILQILLNMTLTIVNINLIISIDYIFISSLKILKY